MIENYTIEDKKLLTYRTENMQGAYVSSMDASIKRKFPGIYLQDGTAGVVFSNNTQSWQAAIYTVSTFNRTLMLEIGASQGKIISW